MLIFFVWPELVKLPNLHLIRPNTLFLLWACTSGRQREKRAMAPTPTTPPFPIQPNFVLCRDREATRRATARVCQSRHLGRPRCRQIGRIRKATHSPLLRPRFSIASSTARSDNGTSSPQFWSRRPKLRWCQLRTSLLQPHLVPLRR